MTQLKIIKLNYAARMYSVPYRWLKQQAEAGKFPAIRADKTYLVLPKNVETFLLDLATKGGNNDRKQ
jgi:hypothetical protein